MTDGLPLRDEEPPSDATVIIRAGVLEPGSIVRALSRSFDRYDVLGISVEGALHASVLETCQRSPRLAPYRRIRLTTVARIRTNGFVLLPTFDVPHFTLVVPDTSERTIARLNRTFDAAIGNPWLRRPPIASTRTRRRSDERLRRGPRLHGHDR